MHIVLQSP